MNEPSRRRACRPSPCLHCGQRFIHIVNIQPYQVHNMRTINFHTDERVQGLQSRHPEAMSVPFLGEPFGRPAAEGDTCDGARPGPYSGVTGAPRASTGRSLEPEDAATPGLHPPRRV
jgi:hypothetical protein